MLTGLLVGEFPRAWMCISMASRLQSLQSLTISKQKEALSGDERASRCYWSIYLLESAFAHQPAPVGNLGTTSNSPFSGRHPPLHGDKGFMQSEVRPDDPGILAHCIDLVSVWGDLGSYMHELRNDQAEAPWLPTSTRTRIVHHLYESEGRLSRRHYLRNIKLPDRLAHLTSEEQEYWSCWALLQIASHAIPSVLSHPFIHLLTPKPKSWVLKPKVFLQETVDSALYNSAWVARLLQILDGLPIELNNPLIGHMVTATATVLWFFQFAQDTGVSRKARKNLRKCERFLERMVKWPHLVQKVSSRFHVVLSGGTVTIFLFCSHADLICTTHNMLKVTDKWLATSTPWSSGQYPRQSHQWHWRTHDHHVPAVGDIRTS